MWRNAGRGGKEKKEGIKIAFLNVAGIRGKDREFWRELEEWNVMVLMETWVEEKGWKKIKNRLPKRFD